MQVSVRVSLNRRGGTVSVSVRLKHSRRIALATVISGDVARERFHDGPRYNR